jgi:hypothetical protein
MVMAGRERIIFAHCKKCTIIDDISLISYPKPGKGESEAQYGWSRKHHYSTCIKMQ